MINACKKCRREGEKLILKGEKCISPKCAMVKRPYAPGQHGQSFHGKISEYGKQLREKQKAKRIYGISETQFRNYAKKAANQEGNSSLNLLRLLETRVDSIVYRIGLASSRSHARQLVSHGFFKIRGKRINVPSINLLVGDELSAHKKLADEQFMANIPSWIDYSKKENTAKIVHLPERDEIDTIINENIIIEFYSR